MFHKNKKEYFAVGVTVITKSDLKNINYVNFHAESTDTSISPIKIIFEILNIRFF